jgi:sugar phosphate isomerase/epimerase
VIKHDVLAATGRLAVCSWSLQPASAQDLAEKMRLTGIQRVQLALDPLRESPSGWSGLSARLETANLTVASAMFGCVGEDYSTLETIRATGGLAPDATWPQNRQNAEASARLATELGVKLVTFHAGFLPHDRGNPERNKICDRLRTVAGIFADRGITLGMETGQETAAALRDVLLELELPNVGVNFDPANMVLYDKGDPVAALRTLEPWIRQVHIKDAIRTKTPGTWGQEVAAGQGEVNWKAFFQTLREIGFAGNLVIEREAGDSRIADIQTARKMVEQFIS